MTDEYKFKRELEDLMRLRGRHTELVTVYVPDGYELSKVVGKLLEEQGTSGNIKSKTVRKNVTSALEKIVQHLRLFKRTPENGLAIFCGNISDKEGVSNIQLFSIIPPAPLKIALYRCSQTFILEPLQDMLKEKEVYGLIVMDRKDATIGFLKGKRIEVAKSMSSMVPGKTRAGGQSAARFARVRDGLINDWYKRVGTAIKDVFEGVELLGILFGGPGPIKNNFLDGEFISNELKKQIVKTVDQGYSDEYGLRELVNGSEDVLKEAEITKERILIQDFISKIATDGLVTYGQEHVKKALDMGAVKKLIISEEIDPKLMDEFVEFGTKGKAETVIISTSTEEGEQFARLGGFGAFLRFKVDY